MINILPTPSPVSEFCRPSPSYSFGANNEFVMWIADTPELKARASNLVNRMDTTRGYESSRSRIRDIFDTVPGTTTFLVTTGGKAVATLRLVPDSSIALPADNIFHENTGDLRGDARRLCELGGMAVDDALGKASLAVLMELFRLAWLSSRYITKATDMVGTVMAHHIKFYRKILLFDEIDERTRISPKTGCAISFCRLNLDSAEEHYRKHYALRKGARNLHHFFCEDSRIPELMTWLFDNTGSKSSQLASRAS